MVPDAADSPAPPRRLPRIAQVVLTGAVLAGWLGAGEALLVSLSRQVPERLLFIQQAVVGYALFGAAIGAALAVVIEVPGRPRPWRRRTFYLLALPALVLCFQIVLHAGMHWISNRLIPETGRSVRLAAMALGPLLLVLAGLWFACRRWRPPSGWRPLVGRRGLAALAVPLVVVGLLPWITEVVRPRRRAAVPNVLLIVLDTTRADHLSAYGYDRPTTPALERIAEEGLTFTRAYAAAPWTLPSHASIFTGEYPTVHNTHFEHQVLDDRLPTLAEHLAEHGLRTAAFSRQVWLCDETGLMRGFQDLYDLYWRSTTALVATTRLVRQQLQEWRGTEDKGAAQITRTFKRWIDRHGDEPFFAFINYVEPHAVYRPPSPFREQFLAEAHKDTTWGRERDVQVQHFNAGQVRYDESDLAVFRDLYDGEVAYQDHRMGEAIEHLRRLDLLDRTLVIITSDHGENLGDHDLLGHEFCLYNTLLHVPLIVRLPGLVPAGATSDEVVQNRLIWPLVDALLWNDAGQAPLPTDVIAASLRDEPEVGGPAMAELYRRPITGPMWKDAPNEHLLERRLRSLLVRDMKYILGSDGRQELYDVIRDPQELINLAALRKQERDALDGLLDAKVKALGAAEGGEVPEFSEELKRRLRSLGYLD